MARAGRFVTATGVNDDHEGLVQSWSPRTNRFSTGVWASSLDDAGVREALLRGRAWGVEIEPNNTVDLLDLAVDDVVPMGSVSIQQRGAVRSRSPVPSCLLVVGPSSCAVPSTTSTPTSRIAASSSGLRPNPSWGPAPSLAASTRRPTASYVSRFGMPAIGSLRSRTPSWLLRSEPPGGIPPLSACLNQVGHAGLADRVRSVRGSRRCDVVHGDRGPGAQMDPVAVGQPVRPAGLQRDVALVERGAVRGVQVGQLVVAVVQPGQQARAGGRPQGRRGGRRGRSPARSPRASFRRPISTSAAASATIAGRRPSGNGMPSGSHPLVLRPVRHHLGGPARRPGARPRPGPARSARSSDPPPAGVSRTPGTVAPGSRGRTADASSSVPGDWSVSLASRVGSRPVAAAMGAPHTSHQSSVDDAWPAGQVVGISRRALTRTVFVERVSSAISSAASTWRRSRTVPDAASSTSTTLASSRSVPSLPLSAASCAARPSRDVAVRVVAGPAGLQAVGDRRGQLGLAGVVGDVRVDARGHGDVVGPDRPDQRLGDDLAVDDQADPAGQHLVAHLASGDVDAHVVVAALVAPRRRSGSRRCSSSTRCPRPARSSIAGATCFTRRDRRSPRRPQPQAHVGGLLAHGGAQDRLEVGRQVLRVRRRCRPSRAARSRPTAARRPASRCRRRGSRTGTRPAQRLERGRRGTPASRLVHGRR